MVVVFARLLADCDLPVPADRLSAGCLRGLTALCGWSASLIDIDEDERGEIDNTSYGSSST